MKILNFTCFPLVVAVLLVSCQSGSNNSNILEVSVKSVNSLNLEPESFIDMSLKKMYPDIRKYILEIENGFYETRFKLEGSAFHVRFDNDGNWLRTEVDIKFKHHVNQNVLSAIRSSEYDDWFMKEMDLTETPDSIVYKMEFKKDNIEWDIYYDHKGLVLKKEMKTIKRKF